MTGQNTALLARIRIVLVETSHPGNIGGAARAMKTMGLNDLWLVNPKQFPSAEATVRASGADDVLRSANTVDSLEDALKGCAIVFGSTARPRHFDWRPFSPREAVGLGLDTLLSGGDIAIVFGRENSGLTNGELDLCHHAIHIPANELYSSLNLASAVQIVAYELRVQTLSNQNAGQPAIQDEAVEPVASHDELEGLYQHLEQALVRLGYLDPAIPGKLMSRLRKLFNRSILKRSELQILRGICAAIEKQSMK